MYLQCMKVLHYDTTVRFQKNNIVDLMSGGGFTRMDVVKGFHWNNGL